MLALGAWLVLLADALPLWMVPWVIDPRVARVVLLVAAVGTLAVVVMRCQRPLDEVYEAAFRAGEQHERRRWLAAKGSGERVVPLRRTGARGG